MQEIRTGMGEKGINNMRQGIIEKKDKIKTLGTDRCENIDTLYINK